MMGDELYINGVSADMGPSTGINLTWRSNLFADVSKIVGNNSTTIKLPATGHNIALIDGCIHPGRVSRYPYMRHAATVKRDGVEIVTGANMVLIKVSPDSIEVALTWGVSSELSYVFNGDAKLSDLYDEDEYIVWSKDTDEKAREFGGTETFPIADYGFPYSDIDKQYNPVVRVQDILDRISNKYRVTFEYSDTPWSGWVMPLLKASDKSSEEHAIKIYSGTGGNDGEAVARMYATPLVSGKIVSLYGSETLADRKRTEGDTPEAGDSEWRKVTIMTGEPNIKITMNGWLQARVVSPTEIDSLAMTAEFGLFVQGDEEGSGKEFQPIATVKADYIAGKQYYESEKEWRYDVRFSMRNEECSIIERATYHGTDSQLYVKFCSNTESEVKSGHTMTGEFTMTARQVPLAAGNIFYYKYNMPDMKLKDFIKNILGMAGMYAYQKGDKIVISDYRSLNGNISNAYDWSKFIIMSRWCIPNMEFKTGNEAKHNKLSYKGSDQFPEWNDEFTIDNDTLEDEKDAISLSFEAYERNVTGDMRIGLYKYNNGILDFSEYAKPVIGKLVMRSNPYNRRIEYHITPDGLYWSDLKAKYDEYIGMLQDARVITENFCMSAAMLNGIDLTRPVYISQFGAYFGIIEMKTRANNTIEAKLIKIK